ncbi:MAG: hypothetical protein LBT62_02005 [Deltaproteobacteria bacterium]|jgi:hypothetical protein|nr:hypothetical protein [Deltaproteobacteria bacterium]
MTKDSSAEKIDLLYQLLDKYLDGDHADAHVEELIDALKTRIAFNDKLVNLVDPNNMHGDVNLIDSIEKLGMQLIEKNKDQVSTKVSNAVHNIDQIELARKKKLILKPKE